jgi:hypothetical protein
VRPIDDERLRRVRGLARLLDSAVGIPGTKVRFGLDALLGILPAGGDVVGAALSATIVLAAARWGAPASLLARMTANLAMDALVGALPLLGDLADIGWRANVRNVELLESFLESSGPRRRSRGALVGVGVLLVAVVGLIGWAAYAIAKTALLLVL